MLRIHTFTSLAAAGLLAAFALGCNSSEYQTAEVTGHVLCNGKPAVGGVVSFEPIDAADRTGRPAGSPGRISLGAVGDDGTFRVMLLPSGQNPEAPGALIGPHRVSFILPNTKKVELTNDQKALPAAELALVQQELDKIKVFAALECGATISPSEVEVMPGKNSFEFTLSGAPSTERTAPRARRGVGSD